MTGMTKTPDLGELDMTPTSVVVELRRLEAVNTQLLKALEHALVWNEDASPEPAWVTDARAAIKAAKGET
jgi:hypothetical protein